MYRKRLLVAFMIGCTALTAASFGAKPAAPAAPAEKPDANKLLAVLKSDAPYEKKAAACRELALVAGPDAVAPLAAMLSDEKLTHMVRYALEAIPDASVDQAFRDALGKLHGRPLVGVIGSISARRDSQACAALAGLLQDADAEVAQAAARALGRLGTAQAVDALLPALEKVSDANRLAFCEGLFRCAESLLACGQRDRAIQIYDALRAIKAPQQVRAGGLRGAILARQEQGLPLLKEALKADDFVLFDAAVGTAIEISGPAVADALLADARQLPADRQIVIYQAIGKRKDVSALPALLAAAKAGEKSARIAALRAAIEMGQGSTAAALAELMNDADKEISQIAQDGYASLPAQEVDAAIMSMFDGSAVEQKLLGIELIARRRMAACLPALMKLSSESGDAKVRAAALKCVREMAGDAELPAMCELLVRINGPDADAVEQVIVAILQRAEKPESFSAKLVGMMSSASPVKKSAILRVLSTIGGAEALAAVRAVVNDSAADSSVRATAVRALGTWKTADTAADLLDLAKNSPNPTEKLLGLRGYLAMAGRKEVPGDQRMKICRDGAALVQRAEEKKLLLSSLGSIANAAALSMIAPYLDDASVKEEACAAAVNACEKLTKGRGNPKAKDQVTAAMEKVLKITASNDVSRRAKAVLEAAKNQGK